MISVRVGRSEREDNYSDALINDTDVALPKHVLLSVTDCSEGRSIPSFHSISSHLATQNTLLWKNKHSPVHLPHITTSEEEDLFFISAHFTTFQRQQRIVEEWRSTNRNKFKKRTVLDTTCILGNNGCGMHKAVILHNELHQFREMTYLHTQNVREGIGTNVNGLQTRIVLQTQLCHILFTSTMWAAIQMSDGGGQGRLNEGLRIGEAIHTVGCWDVFSPSGRIYTSQHQHTHTLDTHLPCIMK